MRDKEKKYHVVVNVNEPRTIDGGIANHGILNSFSSLSSPSMEDEEKREIL